MSHLLSALQHHRWQHKHPGEVVILDNRDSFVYNLVHRFEQLDLTVVVVRSDEVSLETLIQWQPAGLVISPGPGYPIDAGVSIEAIRHFSGQCPILGVCLGHQAIGEAFGGRVSPSGVPKHGVSTMVTHHQKGLFEQLPSPLEVGRYHALVVEQPVPESLMVTARGDGLVMGLKHREHPTYGVQFHPESILTPMGLALLCNWARLVCGDAQVPGE